MKSEFNEEDLTGFRRQHETLVGIDSDGCVFGTMDVKQKNHFHPLIIDVWSLEKIENQVRAAAEFINLYSLHRGKNRFLALLQTFELLKDWQEVRESGVRLPSTAALGAYCNSGLPLGNPSLETEVVRTGDSELARVLEWSLAVNRDIDANMKPIEPFKWAVQALEMIAAASDALVVSQTPEEALVKEWRLHGLADYVGAIAGQELGTKSEHLSIVMKERYPPNRVLMIGDAPGDMRAAAAVGAWFYPIIPLREEESWQRFCERDYNLFLEGTFNPEHQEELVEEYRAGLPSIPPWKNRADQSHCLTE